MSKQTSTQALRQQSAAREAMELKVFIVGGGFQYAKMFFDAGFTGATSVAEADIVCFTGGEDVDPSLYGQEIIPGTHINKDRDNREMIIFSEAAMSNKPMVGICRGAQFLNVMNGGGLWQDVNNHAMGGTHEVVLVESGVKLIGMTSTHHQQMRPSDDGIVIAVAALSTRKQDAKETLEREEAEQDDVEVVWYPDTFSLCFQPHPEFGEGYCRDFFLDCVDDYILPAC